MIVNNIFPGIVDAINSIKQDVIIFIDEYEKIFKERHELLTIMDGVLTTEHRKFFILTTNETYINDNLIQRPGRIRYFQTFGNLKPSVVEEIVDDFLIHTRFKNDIIKFISSLELITIDIIKSIIEEVNIHEESPEDFKDIFNCKKISGRYNVYQLKPNASGTVTETKIYSAVKLNRADLIRGDDHVGGSFYVDDDYMGVILKVLSPYTCVVKTKRETDDDDNVIRESEEVTLRIENSDVMNYAYKWNSVGTNHMM